MYPETAIAPGSGTYLDQLANRATAEHPGQAGFRLVADGSEAFALRFRSARRAERSLDVQTYIWNTDTTGLALASELLAAADRGVRVRLLIDDMDARGKNSGLAALAAHPQVQVRLFNPFASRYGWLRLVGEAIGSFDRINRRMHNKSWIADNQFALVGGRNLGDEYFSASEAMNFEDLDLAIIGPAVPEISDSFDRYWNFKLSYPIEALDPEAASSQSLFKLRHTLAAAVAEASTGWYAEELRRNDPIERIVHGDRPLQWTAHYRFVADDPLKATGDLREDPSNVLNALLPAMAGAAHTLTILSPYFVPGEDGTTTLVRIAQAGRQLRITTNSLAANDVAAVHGGYARHRRKLLEGGVELWEIKPRAEGQGHTSFRGSSNASLHTKAMAIDSRMLFVGSFNLDPRSAALNCEQGVLIEDADLAKQLEALFARQTRTDRAWSVTLRNGHLSWTDGRETFGRDPQASLARRFQAWLARTLRLDSQL